MKKKKLVKKKKQNKKKIQKQMRKKNLKTIKKTTKTKMLMIKKMTKLRIKLIQKMMVRIARGKKKKILQKHEPDYSEKNKKIEDVKRMGSSRRFLSGDVLHV